MKITARFRYAHGMERVTWEDGVIDGTEFSVKLFRDTAGQYNRLGHAELGLSVYPHLDTAEGFVNIAYLNGYAVTGYRPEGTPGGVIR